MPIREHNIQSGIPQPYIHCPFTSDALDIYGHLTFSMVSGASFSPNGAYYNGTARIYTNSAGLTNEKFKTIHIKFMMPALGGSSSVWTILRVAPTYNVNGINFFHAPAWSQDLNAALYYGGSTGILTVSSVPFVANQWYSITLRQGMPTELFVDGVKRTTANLQIPDNSTMNAIEVGYTQNNSSRGFRGYIKDFMTWDTQLTDEQIALL